MDFFASLPQEPRVRPAAREPSPVWVRPSFNVLPAAIPGNSLLIHRPTVAVSLDSLRVFPDALTFAVHVQYRGGRDPGRRRVGFSSPFRAHQHPADQAEAKQVLRFGVLYTDGRRAVPERRVHPQPGHEPRRPVIRTLSGHGTDGEWYQDFYIWGLPDEGPITLVYDWLDQDVPESRYEIDGDAVRAAADRIVVLWDDDGDDKDGADGGDGKAEIGSAQ